MCSLGAGIVVDTLYVPPLFNQLLYDPLCVLLLEDRTLSFGDLDPSQVSISSMYVYLASSSMSSVHKLAK